MVERTSLDEAQAEIERLRLIIRKLQRDQFGRKAERLNADQLQLGLEDLGADLARAEAGLSPARVRMAAIEADAGRLSLPEHLAREEVRLYLDHHAIPSWSKMTRSHNLVSCLDNL